jgi:hypothetical protein
LDSQEDNSFVEMSQSILGIDTEGSIVVLQSLLLFVEFVESHASVDVDIFVVRIILQGLNETS